MHSLRTVHLKGFVCVLAAVFCLSVVSSYPRDGIKRTYSKRYAMMDLALTQIYDICDNNGDRMLTLPELRCVQNMGNSILGKRRK